MMKNSESIKTRNAQRNSPAYLSRILIKNSQKNIFIDVGEIEWIESSGNYVRIHLPQTNHMIRGSLKNLEEKLNPLQFVRIHRSWMVNIQKVKEIKPWFSGDSKVILEDGKTLKMSRNYKDNLNRFRLG